MAGTHYRAERVEAWNAAADRAGGRRLWSAYYHHRLTEVYRALVAPGLRVVELGCGSGDLLAALEPAVGVGVDFSNRMIQRAEAAHPHLRFLLADVHDVELDEQFDIVVLSDLVNDVWDVQATLQRAKSLCAPRGRVVLNLYSRLWQLPLAGARRLGLANRVLEQSWLTPEDVTNLVRLAGLESVRRWSEILLPVSVPLLSTLANRFLVRLWPFSHLALTNFYVCRRSPDQATHEPAPVVSVVVPARNEAGNIAEIMARTPELGGGTELIFVEGHSSDDTYATIERAIEDNPGRRCRLLRQGGVGKGDAVRLGFAEASGAVLMILDADMTVAPEELPRFLEALTSGHGEFINGVRLVYPMEGEAMRFFNSVANKLFGLAFSWVLGQPVKDTLCGTKVLWKSDYERIVANRAYFGEFDPFGDFDLLFGAARLNLTITDIPVRYGRRRYGTTNISRWRDGWLLLRMLTLAAKRLKFV